MAPDRVLIGGEQTEAGKAAIQVSCSTGRALWWNILRPLFVINSERRVLHAVLHCLESHTHSLHASAGNRCPEALHPVSQSQFESDCNKLAQANNWCAGTCGRVLQLGAH